MVFNSFFFFLTLLPFLALFYITRSLNNTLAKLLTTAYSLFFYGMWNLWFLPLLFLTATLDYLVALGIVRYPKTKKALLIFSLVSNLGTLGFFKYFNFFLESGSSLASLIGLSIQVTHLDIILPVGISFYTFHTLGYVIDVYRGKTQAYTNYLDILLYVAYFPQLVAGPILRSHQFLPQLQAPRPIYPEAIAVGWVEVFFGLALKCVVADNVGRHVSRLFDAWQTNSVTENWAAAMLFGVQIYCDFAGYSMIAIGLGRMMGYTIPRNFHAPYGAAGFSDFWKRWHISLSQWLRDYLYIPLGGNRCSEARVYFNLMVTMILGGLWHGASVRFLLWGFMHGLFLCVEKFLMSFWERTTGNRPLGICGSVLRVVLTFAAVSLTWIPFRATDTRQCFAMLKGLFQGPIHAYPGMGMHFSIVLVVFLLHCWWAKADITSNYQTRPALRFWLTMVSLLSLYYFSGAPNEFIYFQF
jgi:alginate O-acetyltransferase complex protein AlgI